jgi:type IV pilus assembly protein PilN
MILINLLPHREVARAKRKETFQFSLVAAAVVGAVMAGLIYLSYDDRISDQQAKNQLLKSEIKKLESQITEIAGIESEIAALKARQKAVEDLQSDRNSQIYLLNELVNQLPEGVYLTSMKQEGQTVLVQGVAQSNQRVSDVLKRFSSESQWFAKPELVEIQASTMALSAKDPRRVFNFNMRFKLLRASDVEKPADAGTAKK